MLSKLTAATDKMSDGFPASSPRIFSPTGLPELQPKYIRIYREFRASAGVAPEGLILITIKTAIFTLPTAWN
jgi:hypothetical protein